MPNRKRNHSISLKLSDEEFQLWNAKHKASGLSKTDYLIERKKGDIDMKTPNAKELNEKFKDCPTQTTEVEVEGRKYIVISHFTGQKDLDDVVYKNAYNQAMDEVLHA